jgi:2-polyprenyl-3-methyl-5-hydroxy-6-metoxy-1,4-benzoquinol methylase
MLFRPAHLRAIRARRRVLRHELDVAHRFDELEESCVPSYCHANPLAAGVAWMRLLVARDLYVRSGARGPILDFGAATGELFHVLGAHDGYHFVEQNETLAAFVGRSIPAATRERLDALPRQAFGTIFALDALEHNPEVEALVAALVPALRADGRLIVSGPTESGLYRLGRRIAGFSGHYHATTIHHIEASLGRHLRRTALRRLPPVVPLFRISAWDRGA